MIFITKSIFVSTKTKFAYYHQFYCYFSFIIFLIIIIAAIEPTSIKSISHLSIYNLFQTTSYYINQVFVKSH